jgi:hypothetical protein
MSRGDEVGAQALHGFYSLLAVRGRAHHPDVGGTVEDLDEKIPRHGGIFHD